MMRWLCLIPLIALASLASCDRTAPTAPAPGRHPTVASLVPGATDLILGMGAGDHLVAVSTFDVDRPEIQGVPRVGDYQNLDWEKIASLRPEYLLTFMAPDRMPPALRERAGQMNMKLINVPAERLDDIYAQITRLGDLLGETEKAAAARGRLQQRIEAVRQRGRNGPHPRVLIAREANAEAVVGTGTFVDDALAAAGGRNAVSESGWISLDRERIIASKPNLIIHLLPGSSPEVQAQMKAMWSRMEGLSAAREGRVYIIDDWWCQQPGMHVADLAEKLCDILQRSRP